MLKSTGERYHPEDADAAISYEHWHRYLYAARLVKDRVVLDVACGEGYGSDLLARTASRVVGVDRDRDTISHATRRYGRQNLVFVAGTADRIPLNSYTPFDAVVSFETIEHLTEREQQAFLAEVKRLLRPGGVFIVSTPDKLVYAERPQHRNPFHAKELYAKEFEALLGAHFRRVDILGQRLLPVSYIWPPRTRALLVEHALEWTDQGFRPAAVSKESMYAIAVCSDGELCEEDASILVDVSDTMQQRTAATIKAMGTHIQELRAHNQALQAQIRALRGQVESTGRELEAILRSISWRVTRPLRSAGLRLKWLRQRSALHTKGGAASVDRSGE